MRLIGALASAPNLREIVFCSSLNAYGDAHGVTPVVETTPPNAASPAAQVFIETEQKLAALGTDYALSILMDMCRMNFGASLRPLEVTLCRERPADTAPWDNFFGVKVRFGEARNSILLARRDADSALPISNRQITLPDSTGIVLLDTTLASYLGATGSFIKDRKSVV